MKKDGLQRSVRSQKHDRAAGDAPTMGRVSRMPGVGIPKGERRRRRKTEGHSTSRLARGNRTSIYIWTALLGIGACICLAGAIWLGLFRKQRPIDETASAWKPAEAVEKTKEATKFPSPTEDEAIAIAEAGMTLRNPERVEAYFRPGISKPGEIIKFLEDRELEEGAIVEYSWIGSMSANGMAIEGVLVNYAGKDKPRNRVALLVPDETGTWKIDYDAFARVVKPPLEDLIEDRESKGMARVYVAHDTYYNGPFNDDTKWSCYGLASPDVEEVLLGYCEKNSAQDSALKRILSKGGQMARAMVEIQRAENALPRQFIISSVLAEDWVMGEKPFDATFQ